MIGFREAVELARSTQGRRWIWLNLRKRIYSRRESVCLRFDWTIPVDPPSLPPGVELEVRELRPGDDLSFIADAPDLSPEARQLRADQRWLLTQDLPTPWVAVDQDGKVCFITHFLTAQDNARVKAVWGGWLPELQPDEAMVEGSFVAEKYRGMNIFIVAGTQIYLRARERGVRYGIGIIPVVNKSSQRTGEKAGWQPYKMRVESWFLFRRRVQFYAVPDQHAHV